MSKYPNYEYWRQRDLWTVREAVDLVVPFEPSELLQGLNDGLFAGGITWVDLEYDEWLQPQSNVKRDALMGIVCDAMALGTLKPFDPSENQKKYQDRRVRPREVLKWCQLKGFNIPNELVHLLDMPLSEGQTPAESTPRSTDHLNEQEKTRRQRQDTRMAQNKHRAGDLVVIVDHVNESVSVFAKAGSSKEIKFKRSDIVGRGTATWSLLVAFARCGGSLEGNTTEDVKKLNTSVNRKNLSTKLMDAMNLAEPPIVEGRAGVMRFRSIQLAGATSSSEALDRKTISFDEQATEFLKNHGDNMPTLD